MLLRRARNRELQGGKTRRKGSAITGKHAAHVTWEEEEEEGGGYAGGETATDEEWL
jgi:hypothetical protein